MSGYDGRGASLTAGARPYCVRRQDKGAGTDTACVASRGRATRVPTPRVRGMRPGTVPAWLSARAACDTDPVPVAGTIRRCDGGTEERA